MDFTLNFVFDLWLDLRQDILPLFASVSLPIVGIACHLDRSLFRTGTIVYFVFNKLP